MGLLRTGQAHSDIQEVFIFYVNVKTVESYPSYTFHFELGERGLRVTAGCKVTQ